MKSLLLLLMFVSPPPAAWPPPGQVLGPDCEVTMHVSSDVEYADGDKLKAMQMAYADVLSRGVMRLECIRKAMATTHDYDLTRFDEDSCTITDRRVSVRVSLYWHCK